MRLGRTVLIAESELQHVPDYAKRIYVMERGEMVFGGSLDEARRDANSAPHYRRNTLDDQVSPAMTASCRSGGRRTGFGHNRPSSLRAILCIEHAQRPARRARPAARECRARNGRRGYAIWRR